MVTWIERVLSAGTETVPTLEQKWKPIEQTNVGVPFTTRETEIESSDGMSPPVFST